MSRIASWRAGGSLAVVVFPFLILFGQKGIPSGKWWDDVSDPAVLCTGLIGVGALANGVYGIVTAAEQGRLEIKADLQQLARRAFVPINAHLAEVPINRLGVHIWMTRGDRLERLVKYTMEQQRVATPMRWIRGKGVLGVAWATVTPLTAELGHLYAEAEQLDAASFNALEPGYRYGLSRDEVLRGTRYKSVLAHPLADEDGEVIGILSVDCGVEGHGRQLAALLDDRAFQDVLGSCEIALRRYMGR